MSEPAVMTPPCTFLVSKKQKQRVKKVSLRLSRLETQLGNRQHQKANEAAKSGAPAGPVEEA